MSSKTSFFSKSIIKSDLKRFWWVGLLETVILFLTNTLPLWYRVSDGYRFASDAVYEVGRVITWNNLQFVIPIAFAISVVSLLFSYMHQVASVSLYHSVPVTRKGLYVSKLFSSLILTIMPILINTLIIWGICATTEANVQAGFIAPLVWLYVGIVYTVLMISLALFVNMMTGTPIGTLLFSMGAIFLPLIGIAFYEFFCSNEVFGFSWDSAYDCLEWIYITEKNLLDIPHLMVYVVVSLVFYAFAYLLYKKRKLEMYGEVIAFRGLVPVFIGIISVIASMASYAYLGEVLRGNNVFYAIPLGLLGTIIAWMVSRKSISPKGILKPVISYLVVALAIIGFVKLDISGFERRIPDVSEVEWVDILDVYNNNRDYVWINNEKISYTVKGELDTKIYDEKGIEAVIAMHRYAVENRYDDYAYTTIPVMYKLKNGKTIQRRYQYNYARDMEVLKPVHELSEIRAKRYDLLDGGEKVFREAMISDRRVSEGIRLYGDNPALLKLVEAIKKDFATITYEDMFITSGGSINISYDYNVVLEDVEKFEDDTLLQNYTQRGGSVLITDKYVNTMAVLDELGFLSKIPTADQIDSCNVAIWRNNAVVGVPVGTVSEGVERVYITDNDQPGTEVEDRAEIEKLYGMYKEIINDKKFTDYNNCVNVRVTYRVGDHHFEASCSYDEERLPEIFKKYI